MRTGRPRKPANRATRPNRFEGQPAAPFTTGEQPPGDPEWSAGTREWWETWGASDYADYLTQLDWETLATTALLRERVHVEGELRFAAEFRIAQSNVRDLAEKRMIHHQGVASVRPDDTVIDVDFTEQNAIESVVKVPEWRLEWYRENHPEVSYVAE